MLDRLSLNLPTFDRYIEPFVGGGALLFKLAPHKALINDINHNLTSSYLVIKYAVESLIMSLREHKNEAEYYYSIRDKEPATLIERASRFIYLNKTCFNGLYRENSKGKFNASFGRYKNPAICDEENLLAINQYLLHNEVDILNTDFREVADMAGEGDLVYFDPPYHPLNETVRNESFKRYNKNGFGEQDQVDLAEWFKKLSERGCYVMMSNSNTEFIHKLYSNFKIEEVSAIRRVNNRGDGRQRANIEIIVRNF